MTTKEKIEIMQAYEEGKTIEWTYRNDEDEDEKIWYVIDNPSWDWHTFNYRIKPKEKYRPYKDATEMIEDWKARFNPKECPSCSMPLIWVRLESTNAQFLVYSYLSDSVAIGVARPSFLGLFEDYTYLDGSPCGKEIKE